MKKILITGKDSYIGTSFERWLREEERLREREDENPWKAAEPGTVTVTDTPARDDGAEKHGSTSYYMVDTLDVRDDAWKDFDFSPYDVVLHVAGIAHRRESRKNAPLYYRVNRDLTLAVAEKARQDGVGQFIFLSSMSVYGLDEGVITRKMRPCPTTHYGRSKLQAERGLRTMEGPGFRVAVLRPPMVYGKGCRGNYPALSRLARTSPVFPYTKGARSMIYIENLCAFIEGVIWEEKRGTFFPRNWEDVNVSDLALRIAAAAGHRLCVVKGLEAPLRLLGGRRAKKVLGSLVYDIGADRCRTVGYAESVRRTEGAEEVEDARGAEHSPGKSVRRTEGAG